jgi:tetratricopeptide (TPR) repeat protein
MRIEEDIFLPDSDLEIEVERPNTFRKVAIFLAVAAGLGVSCLAVGGFFYVVFKNASRTRFEHRLADRSVVMPVPDNESEDQRQSDVRTGFGGSPSGADPQTLAGVNAYFDKLVEATRANDANRFRSLMSARRFMDEVKKRGLIKQLNQSDEEGMIKDFAEKWLSIPVNWSRYRIVNVRSSNYWRDAVVYAYFWDELQSVSEVRFWLTREGEGWIAYDWELLEFGVRESMTAAAFIHYGNDPRLDDHIQAASESGQAYRQSREGNRDAAVALVTQSEKRRSVPELADRLAVNIAYTWRSLGEPRRAVLAARKVKSPRMAAGALFVQGEVYEQYGLHRRALEFARQYEEAIGAGPASAGLLANIHERLGNRAEAIEYRQAELRFDPDNAQSLMSLAEMVDESQRNLLLDLIRQTGEPVERAVGLFARVANVGDRLVARAVADFVIAAEPESARAAAVEARLARAQGDHARAAAQFKIAWERSADDERESYVAEYLTAMAAAGKSLEGYEQAPDPGKAFAYFASGSGDDDEALPPEALDALFAAHRQRFPDDPWLHFYSGHRFQEKQDYSAAEREYRAAIEHAGEEDVATYRNSLLFLLLQAGKVLEAYHGILPPEEAFQRIVDRSRWSQPPADLTELHKQHAAAFPNERRLD